MAESGEWSVDNCVYRNGEKPREIVHLKTAYKYCVISVDHNGCTLTHLKDGRWAGGDSPQDLLPLPKPPRPWSKAGDVDASAKLLKLHDCVFRIYSISKSGVACDYITGKGELRYSSFAFPIPENVLWTDSLNLEAANWLPCTTTGESEGE